jgi:glycine cleavage system H protein
MSDLRYTKDHEWVRLDGDVAVVGISDYAQKQLGDVVYVELPAVGKSFAQGAEACTVESVKAASDVFAPVSGDVIEANAAVNDDPSLVNTDPLGKGWFIKLRVKDKGELAKLMDEAAYAKYVEGLDA